MSCSAMFVDELWDLIRGEIPDNCRRIVAQKLVRLLDGYNWKNKEECQRLLTDAKGGCND